MTERKLTPPIKSSLDVYVQFDCIDLLRDSLKLRAYEMAGVDNWDSGGMVREFYEDLCAKHGLDPET